MTGKVWINNQTVSDGVVKSGYSDPLLFILPQSHKDAQSKESKYIKLSEP